jgi:DNA-binding transcriptional regulator GbsR (MarR family)
VHGRRKYYRAETDFLEIMTNILSGREMRDVERAIAVMDVNTNILETALPTMNETDQKRAELYIERMADMRAMFRFARLVIESILGKAPEIDLDEVSRFEIK